MVLSLEASHPGRGDLQSLILEAQQDIHTDVEGGYVALAQGCLGWITVYRDGILKTDGGVPVTVTVGGVPGKVTFFRTAQVIGYIGPEAAEDLEFGVYPVSIQEVDGQTQGVDSNAGIGDVIGKVRIVLKTLRLADMGAGHGVHQCRLEGYPGVAQIIFGEDARLVTVLSPGIFLGRQAAETVGLPEVKGGERPLNPQAELCKSWDGR